MQPVMKRIMIVDDSPAMRSFIKRSLQLGGVSTDGCLEAGNGREALDLLQREHADLILADFNMPVMDGEQFVIHLRQNEALQRTPVIVVSTDSTNSRIARLQALGVDGYLCKPFTPEKLVRTLRASVPDWNEAPDTAQSDEGGAR
jgi:two-component system chemotaxis response regulator CheY